MSEQSTTEEHVQETVTPAAQPSTVAPTQDDPFVAGSSERIGGPLTRRWLPHSEAPIGWWNPIRALIAIGAVTYLIGIFQKVPCIASSWASPDRYLTMCYSDIPPLYALRGFSSGVFPYISDPLPGQEQLEYPVLTGMFMQIGSWLTPVFGNGGQGFFTANVIMLFVCFVVAIVATAKTVPTRPWDAALLAAAPCVALNATINWDMLAIALTAVAILLWARRNPVAAGIFLGLAAAAKFYPFLLFGPILVVCWRTKNMKAFWQSLAGGIGAWLVINIPFMLINFEGWFTFYSFSSERGQDFGSVWMMLSTIGIKIPADALNILAMGLFLVLCLGIAILGLKAPKTPRLAQLAFLVLAAFILTNKIYSPQFVLWLIPLAALARPRWRDFLIWQAGEVFYFASIWLYLAFVEGAKGFNGQWYAVGIFVHLAATTYFCIMIVRDILNPEHDPKKATDASEAATGSGPEGAEESAKLEEAALREELTYRV
ncbi:MAG: glycosyltransferase 87 family protein [Candidatus Nanopelagicales bacterium]